LVVKKGVIGEKRKEMRLGGTAKPTPFTLATSVNNAFLTPKSMERREKVSNVKKPDPLTFN